MYANVPICVECKHYRHYGGLGGGWICDSPNRAKEFDVVSGWTKVFIRADKARKTSTDCGNEGRWWEAVEKIIKDDTIEKRSWVYRLLNRMSP